MEYELDSSAAWQPTFRVSQSCHHKLPSWLSAPAAFQHLGALPLTVNIVIELGSFGALDAGGTLSRLNLVP